MRRLTTLAALTVVLLGVSACTSDKDKDKAPEATSDDSTCNELLGDAGLKWLKERTGDKARLKVEDDLKTARSVFHQQIENFYRKAKEPGPKDPLAHMFQKAEVCESKKDFTKRGKELEIQYGPAGTAFDRDLDDLSDGGFTYVETPVNSDVKLIHMTNPWGTISYTVNVKCKIPGTPAKQANDFPLEGTLSDTLTGETSTRVLYTHLLHSAKVVANTFGCENKPVIPAEPPPPSSRGPAAGQVGPAAGACALLPPRGGPQDSLRRPAGVRRQLDGRTRRQAAGGDDRRRRRGDSLGRPHRWISADRRPHSPERKPG
ncbi:hypothetical protein ACIQMR_21035 [Streptomyces sp. NPDC091376]|uniref:hypothetical protein n=1 Tax=Streptomyces sp. NPDC091376 TaxID=3365994 RepID=UPI00382A0DA8